MKALILVAHGSRRDEANEEFVSLVGQIAEQVDAHFDLVRHAYLEITSPDLASVIGEAVKSGASNLRIVPYFLGSGSHVTRDIPAIILNAEDVYPDVTFEVTEHIGASEEILGALAALAKG